MACHEIAALRLGLMQILGIKDEAERQHELAELNQGEPLSDTLRVLSESGDFGSLKRFFETALVELEERVARTKADDPQMPYLRTLIVLTKKVELDLRNQLEAMTRFYRDLDEMHDFVHEMFPAPN
ncbi:MAG TPA: DUF3209 family protein [Pirellulales bacterium]|jgi:hypothetical protein|nr:DUF3209 family protein [Pirellulales bacterium]